METGSEQKIELPGKSGLKEFRNDHEESRAQIGEDMERKMNIKGLGNPTGVKTQVLNMVLLPHKQPQLPSLPSEHPTPSYILDSCHIGFSGFFNVSSLSHPLCLCTY